MLACLALSACGEEASLRALSAPNAPPGTATVVAVGDADLNRGGRALAARIAAERPDRILYLGDVYPAGTPIDFLKRFEPLYGRFGRRVAPTPGNHEWPNRRTGYEPYWRRVRGAAPPWYAFRLGGWEILSLNSEADHGRDSDQLRWLRRRLARRRTTCRIAFWHRPRHSAGEHGDQPDVRPLWDALRGHAAIVLAGHDHDLQRHEPRDGIVQLVSGAGGRRRYEVDRDYPGLAFASDDHVGAVRLRLERGVAATEFFTASGRRLDRSTIRCR